MNLSDYNIAQKPAELAGVILAGGASSRMGENKALLSWNGDYLLNYLINVIRPYCNPLIVVMGHEAESKIGNEQIQVIHDKTPYPGPLIGLQSAFHEISDAKPVLVTGCDYPFVTPDIIPFLLSRLEQNEAVIFQSMNNPQPMPGLYLSNIKPKLDAVISAQKKSLQAFLDCLQVRVVNDDERQLIDPFDRLLINLNNKDDYEQAKKLQKQLTSKPES